MKFPFISISLLFLVAAQSSSVASIYTSTNDGNTVVGNTISEVYNLLIKSGDTLNGKTVTISSDVTENTEQVISSLSIQSNIQGSQRKITLDNGRLFDGILNLQTSDVIFSSGATSSGGGAIRSERLNFSGESTIFSKNSAYSGGAIYGNDIVLFGSNTFTENSAERSGGGIYSSGQMSIDGNNLFSKNTSQDSGGALFVQNDLTISGKNNFSENISSYQGGAIISGGNITILGENKFEGNSAESGGGAISGKKTILSGKNVFKKNSSKGYGAGGGGAISGTVSISGENWFEENCSAASGGAIEGYGGSITSDTNSTNIFIGNCADGDGGAIHSRLKISLSGKNTFRNNSCRGDNGGGAIFAWGNISLSGENTFENNFSSQSGGAIAAGIWTGDGSLSISGKNIFKGNSATWNGGAIHVTSSNKYNQIDGNNVFEQNKSGKNGGAISINNDIATISGKNRFLNNIALEKGGAICADQRIRLLAGEMFFRNNSAGGVSNDIQAKIVEICGKGIYDFGGGIVATTYISDNATVFFREGAINTGSILDISGPNTQVFFENSSNQFSKMTISDGAEVTFTVNHKKCAQITETLVNDGVLVFLRGNLESGDSVNVFVNRAGNAIHASGAVIAFGGTYADGVFTAGATNIVVGDIDAPQELSAGTSLEISAKSSAVTLSAAAESVIINAAKELDASSVVINTGNLDDETLAAWSFDVENGEGAGKSDVLVVLNVGQYRDASTIKIFHKADSDDAEWEDYTNIVRNISYDEIAGTLSFITADFSSYAVTASAIPEPSMFGLLAGGGILALVASRRRRQR